MQQGAADALSVGLGHDLSGVLGIADPPCGRHSGRLDGVYLLINARHPQILAHIRPTRLALWSFVAATAHGAGLMLVPIFMGICPLNDGDTDHQAFPPNSTGKYRWYRSLKLGLSAQ